MPGKQLALLIGNGTFGASSGFAALRCPSNDVRDMAALLQNKAHGDFEVTPVVDATQREITKAIYDVLNSRAAFDDTVLVYYSGHGCPDDDGSLFLAASDSSKQDLPVTAVPVEFLVSRMRASKSQKVLLILDCCFSGSVEKCFTKGDVAEQVKSALPKPFSGSGTYVLTASTDTQLAEEKEGDTNSLLTKHILAGVTDGAADQDDDGIVTVHELVVYVQEAVSREGSQRPLGFELRAGGGDMVFARTGLTDEPGKIKALAQAIWDAQNSGGISMDVAQCAWSLLSLEAIDKEGAAARKRITRFYSLIGEQSPFLGELWKLYNENKQAAPVPQKPLVQNPVRTPDDQQPVKVRPVTNTGPATPVIAQPVHLVSVAPPKRGWSPLVITLVVCGGGFALLMIVLISFGILQAVNDNSPHPNTLSTMNPNAESDQSPALAFNVTAPGCSGVIYEGQNGTWINRMEGTCSGGNGPVAQVARTDEYVVLKGPNGPGYVQLPLHGGTLSLSSYGPQGPWMAWGYATRK